MYSTQITQTNGQASLAKRGIAQIAQQAKWQEHAFYGQPGWAYPVYDYASGAVITTRWKASPSATTNMKYGWIPSKPKNEAVDWYILPQTADAIAATDGICYLANGEPALLAYHAAGIHNVIATTLSEISVPANALTVLHTLGVSRLLYPVDNDSAGEKSALKWRDALRGSGVDFVPLSWGDAAPPKADANDMWIQVAFDSVAFAEVLAATHELVLPAPEPLSDYTKPSADSFDLTPQGLLDANASALGIVRWRSNGWSYNVSSPFHEDKKPSFGVRRDNGVGKDFATGENYSPTDIADALGINWRAFYPQKETVSKPRTETRKMSDWADSVSLPSYTADLRVNLRYISELATEYLAKRTLRVKSPLATGKTALIGRSIERFQQEHGREPTVLVQTHSQVLVNNISARLGIHSYQDVPMGEDPRRYIDLMPQLAITYDSLHYVADREFDLVFIDEFEQNMAHLSGGTMDGTQARRAYDTLCAVLRSAGQVVVADAHLTDNLKKWLVSLRGAEGMLSIENTYRHDWDALTLYGNKASLISQALSHAQRADKPVVITANSRAETELLGVLFAGELGENNVFVINGWNSSHKTRRFFLQAIDAQIATKQVVICSPTIGTGIDIQAEVAGVYGIFGRDTWGSATTIMQQMMRFRNAAERHLYVQPVFAGAEETDPQARYQRHIDRARGTASLAYFGDFNTQAIDTTDRAILIVESIQKASRAIQRNDLFSYTVAYAKDEGFTIAYDETSDHRMGERLSELRSELQADARDKTLSLDPIDHEQFDDLLQRGEVKRESYYGNLRWKIEQTAGQAINEELYGLLRTARLRADFNRFVDMQGNLGDLQQRDRDQAHYQHLLSQRGHYTRNVQLITGALQAVFGVDWHLSKATFTTEDIAEKLVPYLTACLRDIQVYIDHRTDLSIDPVALLRRLLKRVALKLTSKQQRVNGERVRVYSLDRDHLTRMRELASTAIVARRERQESKKQNNTVSKPVTTSLDKRELRQPTPFPAEEEATKAQSTHDTVAVTLSTGETVHIPF